MNVAKAEEERQGRQLSLDSEVDQKYRNAWGQFATPPELAKEIAQYALDLAPTPVSQVLEPSCGSGSFIHAVLSQQPQASITGVELDPRFAGAAETLWPTAEIHTADYMEWVRGSETSYDLVIANPPYTRHHHLSDEQKRSYQQVAQEASGVASLSKLSSLYVPFLLASHRTLTPNGVGTWLIPSEVMSTNYGQAVREYLTNEVSLERIHVFDAANVRFSDALVTSCVITFRNETPADDHTAKLTFGSSYEAPEATRIVPVAELGAAPKWLSLFPHRYRESVAEVAPALGTAFVVRRGIATGGNKFFIRSREEFHRLGVSDEHLSPIAPMPRNLKVDTIESAEDGWPSNVDQLALLNVQADTPPEEVRAVLESVPEDIRNAYLIRKRSPWWKQEQRIPAPILVTYMGRGSDAPFRFIRNRSACTYTNSLLGLYLRPDCQQALDQADDIEGYLDAIVEELRSIPPEALVNAGREYGGGLKKLEPKELMSVPLRSLASLVEVA